MQCLAACAAGGPFEGSGRVKADGPDGEPANSVHLDANLPKQRQKKNG
jgi:hypothetical protein